MGCDNYVHQVRAYSTKQLTTHVAFHVFILLRTVGLSGVCLPKEKTREGLTIQRKYEVKDSNGCGLRLSPVKLLEYDEGTKTISDIVDWIVDNKELQNQYVASSENCERFGRLLFDFAAKSKSLAGHVWF